MYYRYTKAEISLDVLESSQSNPDFFLEEDLPKSFSRALHHIAIFLFIQGLQSFVMLIFRNLRSEKVRNFPKIQRLLVSILSCGICLLVMCMSPSCICYSVCTPPS